MKQPLTLEQSLPLNEQQSRILLTLIMAEHNPEEKNLDGLISEDLKASFFYQVYQRRIEGMKLPLKLSSTALIFLLCLADRVGHIPCFMVDCLELQRDLGKDHLTLTDVVEKLYPYGFYNEEAFGNRIDNELKPRKGGEFDFVY